jgi:hypothetical protein
MPWPCAWCGHINMRFSQNRDPATVTVAELVTDVVRHGLAPAPARPQASGQGQPVPAVPVPVPGGVDMETCPTMPDLIPVTAFGGVPLPVPGSAGPPPPRPMVTAPRPRRRGRYAVTAVAVAVAAVAFAAGVLVATEGTEVPSTPAKPAADPGSTTGAGSGTRAIKIAVGQAGTVELQGVPGQLSIAGSSTGRVMLTGQLQWTGRAPVVVTRLDRAASVLLVSVQCATASPCTQNLVLSVPADTAAIVRQPSGHVVLTGLAGPLSITAAHVDITASGLTSPALTAAITSGHLSAAFTSPPRRVSISLASAQATLRLPASAAYRVTRRVVSGFISVAVPEADSALRTVTAFLDSSELQLLPS